MSRLKSIFAARDMTEGNTLETDCGIQHPALNRQHSTAIL